MRPFREHLPRPALSSLALLDRRLPEAIPFQWHHHPEWELTLTLHSRGQRFIGDHMGEYAHGDLVLVGPNLPHTWASTGPAEGPHHHALVLWFHPDWIAPLLASSVEFQPVEALLRRGATGLSFAGAYLAPRIAALFEATPSARLIGFLALLCDLAQAPAEALSTAHPPPPDETRARIDRVLTHLHAHYDQPLRLPELAEIAALSLSGLHRMFLRHTGQGITDYLMALRIGAASARLSATDQPIAHIAADVGYATLANFNRQFLRLRGQTPRAFRARFRAPPLHAPRSDGLMPPS